MYTSSFRYERLEGYYQWCHQQQRIWSRPTSACRKFQGAIPFVKLDKCSLKVNIDDELEYASDISEQTDKLNDDMLKLKMRCEQELTDLRNKQYELANKNVMTKQKMKLQDTSMQFIDDMF